MRVSGLVESEKIGCAIEAISDRGVNIHNIEHEEVAYGMAFRKKKLTHETKPTTASYYRQLIRSIGDCFVLSPTTSVF